MELSWRKKAIRQLGSLTIAFAALWLSGCSVNGLAANYLGDALAGGGAAYTTDDDPELIRAALPFALKTFESLLQLAPDHQGLLLGASRSFTAYAFLLQNENLDAEASAEQRARIRNFFLRGRDYALAGLVARHADFTKRLRENLTATLAATGKADIPFLYWAGTALGGAISTAKGDLNLLAELPLAGALMQKVLELDESYERGAAHEFFITYEASRPGGANELARKHYRRALELSAGERASVHLALAEGVAVKEQNLGEFHALLTAAMAVAEATTPQFRLVNAVARQRAAWLQKHVEDLFLDASTPKENAG